MKYSILSLLLVIFACQNSTVEVKHEEKGTQKTEKWTKFEENDQFGFKNSKGEIKIPLGKYSQIWTDKFEYFAIVFDEKNTNSKVVAIDQNEKILFEVFMFDNYPDEMSEGLFRVRKNGKLGFANDKGEIVIDCKYACVYPFEGGKAKVTMDCEEIKEGEYTVCKSDNWFFIDKKGNKVK